MHHHYHEFKSMDDTKRYMAVRIDQLERMNKHQKQKRKEAEDELSRLKKEYEKLKKENEEIKRQRDRYKDMMFKKNIQKDSTEEESELLIKTAVKKRGGQIGHTGHGRSRPQEVHFSKRIYTKICPDCHTKLKRSSTCLTHTVEDIPAPQVTKPMVTQYKVERQWCGTCKKEVTAKPIEVIPGSKLGINLVTYIMLLKYGAKVPLDAIVLLLENQYGITVSKGGIIQILHRTKHWLGSAYQKLKAEMRASPIIHADETGWRVEGINKWIWTFLSKTAVTYQVEESRGRGVPQEFFKDGNPTSVLVRDDYAAYQSIPLAQQSCWAHMLRKSHEALEQTGVSGEMRRLHKKLKAIYEVLETELQQPFKKHRRENIYDSLLKDMRVIIRTSYRKEDALRIQTRIRNQNKNLLTGLLYKGVPLTNNHAERNIRPLVVTRKISGGSRSPVGAQTHMVNMSIFQTIKLKNQPLIPTLKEQLLRGVFGNN